MQLTPPSPQLQLLLLLCLFVSVLIALSALTEVVDPRCVLILYHVRVDVVAKLEVGDLVVDKMLADILLGKC